MSVAPRHLRLPMLPSIKDILRMYEIKARRQLSQNFLLDMNLTRKIVSFLNITETSRVCEVGPGPGGITRAILERFPQKLEVVEKDARFLPSLELLADASQGLLTVTVGDIRNHDFSSIFPLSTYRSWDEEPPDTFVVGNLPFNVSTYLITRWFRAMCLREGPFICGRTNLVLTFQKEVGERLVAPILHAQRCRLSVVCQAFCEPTFKFTIPGRTFFVYCKKCVH
ncbi:unnamed protein product [Soboliphyme baturini]|uniref:rRNA adenine N(6)-methyltransferase n=1 Tax=Soboliphyme baturini TaxID=241478 RepID=A0A183J2B2_9BILA|nr:unnamed protein product [Soboliphyme baturini]